MARPAKPPRIELRGKIWQLIDGALRQSTDTESREEAEQILADYLAGKDNPAPVDRSVRSLLAAYLSAKHKSAREKLIDIAVKESRKRLATTSEIDEIIAGINSTKLPLTNTDIRVEYLTRHLGKLSLSSINSGVMAKYVVARRAERKKLAETTMELKGQKIVGDGYLTDSTIMRDIVILRAALAWADKQDRRGWFGASNKPEFETPVSTTPNQRTDYCTKEQSRLLIESATMYHIKLFLRLGFATAARKEAISDLTWDKVDFNNNTIDFGDVSHNKRRPLIGMTPELRKHLQDAHAVRCCNYVVEYRGKRAGDVKKGIAAAAKAANLPWFTSHHMKHSFVTWLATERSDDSVDRRKTIEDIANMVNTTSDTLRRHYRHLFGDLDQNSASILTLDT